MEDKKLEPVLKDKIRLDIIFLTIVKNWKKFIIPVVATGIISSLLVLCIPRYYTVKVMLAPEYDNGGSGMGAIGGIASMFGINMGGSNGSDAIAPMFYPDLMQSTDFLVPLMYANVTTQDSSFSGKYMDYLMFKQKAPFWTVAKGKFLQLFKKPLPPMPENKSYRANPFALSTLEYELYLNIKGSIGCTVDKKTDVISISTVAQDPLVAALLADTVKQRLQDFITEYRTRKSRHDLEHVKGLCEEAFVEYNHAQKEYADFMDSHRDLNMHAFKIQEDKYSNALEIAHNSYNALMQQKILAEAKLQERTPVFTTLQNSSVPVKAAGPKRMMTVLALTFLSFVITAVVVVVRRKE